MRPLAMALAVALLLGGCGREDEVVEELEGFIHDTQVRSNRERLELILEERPDLEVVHLTPEERERFRQRSLAVRQRYLELAAPRGEEVLRVLLEAVERAGGSELTEDRRRPSQRGSGAHPGAIGELRRHP